MIPSRFVLPLLTALSVCLSPACRAQEKAITGEKRFRLFLETGAVYQHRNAVRVPGDTGTSFSMADLIGQGPNTHFRLTLLYDLNRRTGLRLVYAPLRIDGTGTLGQTTNFTGTNFAPGVSTEGIYQFNSYRLTYWYRFHQDVRSIWRAGVTLKVRDARIALRQGALYGSKYDLGIVPLLYVNGEYRLAPKWNLLVDFDGLAAPQGRAFDFGLSVGYDVSRDLTLTLGYRTLEGGADNNIVYNFSWFNYLTVGAAFRF